MAQHDTEKEFKQAVSICRDIFVKKLKTAKQIKVQASFFQEGDRTFTFTTPVGLEWEH